ncbi:MAG: hypothetical protein EOP06_01940 [Proteobacteria bacterium]|nr:MAG: hypothetical protein EOP06_01940 [Pseudomonadota bacterium]
MKTLLLLLLIFVAGCGTSTSDSTSEFKGVSLSSKFIRGIDESEYTETQGTMKWQFFKSGYFRQEGESYVEPAFYGDTQACSGTATGQYTDVKTADRQHDVTLTYESFGSNITGLCRMSDRVIQLITQPSGYVDIVDSKRVVRNSRDGKVQ